MQYWLSDMQATLSDWMVAVSELPDQHELSKLDDKIRPVMGGMSDTQRTYFDSVIKNRNSIQQFNRKYCVDGDMNPFIYGTSLRMVCREIQSSPLLTAA